MNALWYYAILFLIIWVIALIFRKKLKIEINGPLMMRKTKRMRGYIDSVAKKYGRFWRISMNIGIPVAVIFMVFLFYMLIKSLETVFQAPAVSIIIPGVETGSSVYIPLGYGIIGLATVIIIHEFGHGILARVEGVRIKSIGLLLLAILPGAFVEPNEDDIKKSKRLSKLRIYAAGSIFNLGLAGIALGIFYILSSFFVPNVFYSDGLEIVSVVPNSPSDGILKQGMIIQGINGYPIKNGTDFTEIFNKTKPGDTLKFESDKGTFTVKIGANPSNSSLPYIGIRRQEHLQVNESVSGTYGQAIPWFLFFLTSQLWWIYLLNIGIGTFNLLPMKPLDGGLMFEELLNYITSESGAQKIVYLVSIASFILLALNIGLGFTRFF
ncbi:MAG: PDZ domain-containing protein [Euryarchaeota archaeon]|nr:PDZ domain-containing protein [Euryarchaeota archaeon]